MIFDPTTKKVKADPRIGKLQILREDVAKIFRWVDVKTGQPDEDHYIFPGQGAFEKIKQIPGRVYILRDTSNDQRFFYWLQEDNPANDENIVKKVNDLINEQQPEFPENEDQSEPMQGISSGVPNIPASMPGQVPQTNAPNSQAAKDAQTLAAIMALLAGGMAPKEKSIF